MNALQIAEVGGGILLGIPVATIIAKFTSFLWKSFMGWLFIERSLEDSYSVDVLLRFLTKNSKSFGIKNNRYQVVRNWIDRLKSTRHVFYIKTGQSYRMFMYKGIVPILYKPSTPNPHGEAWDKSCFVFLRGTLNWHKTLLDAGKHGDEFREDMDSKSKNYTVRHFAGSGRSRDDQTAPAVAAYGSSGLSTTPTDGNHSVPIGWTEEDLEIPSDRSPMETLSVTSKMQKVIDHFQFWKSHQTWHYDRGVPWRWGCLLYGPPGTGKTSLVRAIARQFDVPVAIFDLSTMSNQDFLRFWGEAKTLPGASRIVLLEDFDNVFHGRRNVVKGSSLSFDTILNAIGGFERENGLALFVTANDVTKIDPAMGQPNDEGNSTRPGRIDLVAELKGMTYEGLVKIGFRILRDLKLAESMAKEFADDTSASFEDRCMTKAKELLWKEREV